MTQLPRYGALRDSDTIWGFARHGRGIRYIDIRNLMCVDMEVFADQPKWFSLWRLIIFADSTGVERNVVNALERGGDEILTKIAKRVMETPSMYELLNDVVVQ